MFLFILFQKIYEKKVAVKIDADTISTSTKLEIQRKQISTNR